MLFKYIKFFSIFVFILNIAGPALANERTHVAGAPYYWQEKKDNDFGVKFNFGFNYENYYSSINKEYQGDGNLRVVKDLAYTKSTYSLDLGAEFGFKGIGFYFNLPLILSSSSIFRFQDGNNYPGYTDQQDCLDQHTSDPWKCHPDGVNANNSRTVVENLHQGLGFSDNPAPGEASTRTLFKGPNRNGIDQLHLGFRINVPVFNNFTDSTKPFWVIALDIGLPVGKVKDFKRASDGAPLCSGGSRCSDPDDFTEVTPRPELNNAVGRGIYDITISSIMSSRTSIFSNFFKLYATLPFAYSNDSLYRSDYYFSQWGMNSPKAPIKAGIIFGSDINVYNNLKKKIRVNLFLKGVFKAVFQGQDYSEGYELFAGNPMLNLGCNSNNSPYENSLCSDPDIRSNINYFPGLTTVENYSILGAQLGVNMRISRYFFFQLAYGLRHNTEHFITYGDAGDDKNNSGNVELETKEANPYYRPIIDQVGHRYRVQESLIHTLFLSFKFIY
ncbi:MAG: hypothetical protein PF689_00140 [Deltaproteobacteria bacterium]|jgi:hypothetical protein|nr:hypothetical protein [Deltaproteobacteria bacterium]